jgi:hypothetical protein
VNTWSSHEVFLWIQQAQAAGTLKRCAHLSVDTIPVEKDVKRDVSKQQFFIPVCARRSFDWPVGRPSGIVQEISTLKEWLQDDRIRCPANCVHYANARVARVLHGIKTAVTSVRYLAVPFQWFTKLPAAQVGAVSLLILLGICLALPRLLPLITQLLRAYHGQ